jgi:hypothetical protein
MNNKFRSLKFLYSNQRPQRKIIQNSLSVNNIESIKIIDTKKLALKKGELNTDRKTSIKNSSQKMIKLPKIDIYNKIKEDIKSQLYKIKNGNFFSTEEFGINLNKNKIKVKNPKTKRKNKSKHKNKNEDNKFDIDSLIEKFDEKYIINAINKRNYKKNRLNKVYGITVDYMNKLNAAKRKKYLSLKDYQSNILNVYSYNEKNSDESINQLSKKFNNLREETESVIPYPKINFETIFNNIKNKEESDKILNLKSYINKQSEPTVENEKKELMKNLSRMKRNNFLKYKFKSMSNF